MIIIIVLKKLKTLEALLDNYNNQLYSIKDLGAAVRRLISRYLAGKLETTDINEDRDLAYELSREELWEEKIEPNRNGKMTKSKSNNNSNNINKSSTCSKE